MQWSRLSYECGPVSPRAVSYDLVRAYLTRRLLDFGCFGVEAANAPAAGVDGVVPGAFGRKREEDDPG